NVPVEIEVDGAVRPIEPGAAYDESARILSEANIMNEHARTLREWALFEFEKGEGDTALEKWQQARQIYEKIGADKEVAQMPVTPPQLKRE
ncbi:MAG: hypothetical protein L0154_01815, partial [Chloroflexi bacterium]|nr:hypothetical protein [Chloroflexota bacterium]